MDVSGDDALSAFLWLPEVVFCFLSVFCQELFIYLLSLSCFMISVFLGSSFLFYVCFLEAVFLKE